MYTPIQQHLEQKVHSEVSQVDLRRNTPGYIFILITWKVFPYFPSGVSYTSNLSKAVIPQVWFTFEFSFSVWLFVWTMHEKKWEHCLPILCQSALLSRSSIFSSLLNMPYSCSSRQGSSLEQKLSTTKTFLVVQGAWCSWSKYLIVIISNYLRNLFTGNETETLVLLLNTTVSLK